MGELTHDGIVAAFVALDAELQRRETTCELAVVGGAALVLLYQARNATKDVDAVALPEDRKKPVAEAAKAVAAALGLPDDWLNDGAKGYMQGLELADPVWRGPALIVRPASTTQLLAMKLCAWRDDVDIADAQLLLSKATGTREAVWEAVSRFLVPGRELRARYAFDDLWEAADECE